MRAIPRLRLTTLSSQIKRSGRFVKLNHNTLLQLVKLAAPLGFVLALCELRAKSINPNSYSSFHLM
jgi:hypothetical protein